VTLGCRATLGARFHLSVTVAVLRICASFLAGFGARGRFGKPDDAKGSRASNRAASAAEAGSAPWSEVAAACRLGAKRGS